MAIVTTITPREAYFGSPETQAHEPNRTDLVDILQQCLNAVGLDHAYAFPSTTTELAALTGMAEDDVAVVTDTAANGGGFYKYNGSSWVLQNALPLVMTETLSSQAAETSRVAAEAAEDGSEVSMLAAQAAELGALGAKTEAEAEAAAAAISSNQAASAAIAVGAPLYEDTAAMELATVNGALGGIPEGSGIRLYKNVSGTATAQNVYIKDVVYQTVASFLASTEAARGDGVITEVMSYGGRFTYKQVASGDLTNAAGVEFDVLPTNVGLDIRSVGAVMDGVTDDSAAIQKAADICVANEYQLYAPASYPVKLDAEIDLTGITYIDFRADIVVNPAIVAVPVTVGGTAQQISGQFLFNDVSDGTSLLVGTPPSRPIFRVFGSKAVKLELGNCQYMQVYADAATGSNYGSNAYNTINLHGAVYKLELTGAAGVSWNNENFVTGGRIKKLYVGSAGYAMNHNKFINNTFEGVDVDIQFIGGSHCNTIYGARFENSATSAGITFEAGTYSNYITQSWSGVGSPRAQFNVDIPVSDAGMGNMVTSEASFMFSKIPIWSVNSSNVMLGTSNDGYIDAPNAAKPFGALLGENRIIPELTGVSCTYANRYIALSDYIPVALGDVFQQEADYEGNLTRLHVYVFDADMKPLTSEGGSGEYISTPSYSFTTSNGFGYYSVGSNLLAANLNDLAVVRDEVKYVRIGVYAGSADPLIRSYSLSLRVPPSRRISGFGFTETRAGVGVLNGTPTKGIAPVDYLIWDSTASVMRRCTYAHETQVSAALAEGATSVSVGTIASVANGDVVGIVMDDNHTHWSAVSGLTGNTFSISAVPAGRSVASGARIAFNRWA